MKQQFNSGVCVELVLSVVINKQQFMEKESQFSVETKELQ